MTEEKRVEMRRWCPFLLCNRPLPHTHGVCGTCGAVRFGNRECDECVEKRPAEEALELPYRPKKGAQ